MLKDYPEQVDDLKRLIASFSDKPCTWSNYEELNWALEDRVGRYFQVARKELKAAKEAGDAELIAKAEAKQATMGRLIVQTPWVGGLDFMPVIKRPDSSPKMTADE